MDRPVPALLTGSPRTSSLSVDSQYVGNTNALTLEAPPRPFSTSPDQRLLSGECKAELTNCSALLPKLAGSTARYFVSGQNLANAPLQQKQYGYPMPRTIITG